MKGTTGEISLAIGLLNNAVRREGRGKAGRPVDLGEGIVEGCRIMIISLLGEYIQ